MQTFFLRSLKLLPALVLSLSFLHASAQSEVPKGFSKGNIVLTDSTTVSGYIKEKIRSNASLTILDSDNKKKSYDGSSLLSAMIGEDKFICIKGDFFKVIADGDLKFLQKSSDASSKPIYNGNQAIFINGTEGSPGDYFLYTVAGKQLKHLTRKSFASTVSESFAGCNEAISKAKSIDQEIARLNEAVDVYNRCSKNQGAASF